MADATPQEPPTPDAQPSGSQAHYFKKGHDPRRNVTKPGPGRPSEKWREQLRQMVGSPKARKQIKEILEDKNHKHFPKVLATVAAQAHGNPPQPLKHSGDEEGLPIPHHVHVTHEVIDPQGPGGS